jgi:hypothetical protein
MVTQQFDLPHPEHIDPRSGMGLDKASDPNSSILKGLQRNPGGLECRHHAP